MAVSGAKLLLADRAEADLRQLVRQINANGAQEIDFVTADLSTKEGIADVYKRVGVGSGPLMEMDDAGWRYVLESNLSSYVACTRFAVDRMREGGRDDCVLILVGSISVHIKAVGESVYNAAKGGVASFAETLRKELMPEKIRVTLIEPGAIGSSMQPFSPKERTAMMRDHKLLPPEEVAEAIMFAATRNSGVDVVTLRIEPLNQKIF
jgi:NADP-dependent 3-hydroxy acid dehydrogenase YdfG